VKRRVTRIAYQTPPFSRFLQNLGELEGAYIAAAIIPGFIIAVLFYFDHNVSSQMAQQEDFNLKKPAAYNCKDVQF
jgi:hypothetical protein